MSKLDDRLNEILGIAESGGSSIDEQLDGLKDEGVRESFELIEYKEVASKITEAPVVNEDALDDYKYSRKILYGMIERGTSALEGALMVAKESEHPRAYETVTNMMDSISSMTKDLLELQKVLAPKNGKVIKADTINVQKRMFPRQRCL